MTYSSEEESAMELPTWLKLIRFLVIALLCASILAMVAVGWAAIKLVGEASSQSRLADEAHIALPENAIPISFTQLQDGRQIVIYSLNNVYQGEIRTENGELLQSLQFQ